MNARVLLDADVGTRGRYGWKIEFREGASLQIFSLILLNFAFTDKMSIEGCIHIKVKHILTLLEIQIFMIVLCSI